MKTSSSLIRACAVLLFLAACLGPLSFGQAESPVMVNTIAVVGGEQGLGVQIRTSAPPMTEAQMLAGPDRLVIDFPGALPGNALRGFRLNQGDIKAVRAGLFRSNPPVTRVVVDLNAPMGYELVTMGKAVMVKLGSQSASSPSQPFPGVTVERHPTARALAAFHPVEPPLRVGFNRGLLTISAKNATLADVLYQVHLRTGADIPIPSGAEQEQVAIQAGPGPEKDVLATLLNGSRFNFILQGTQQDPQGVGAVILTPKSDIGIEPSYSQPTPVASAPQPSPDAYPNQPISPAQPNVGPQGQIAPPTAPPNPPMQPAPDDPVNEEEQ